MSAPAHQVLVYDGPGTSSSSIEQTIRTLTTLLTPNYTVNALSLEALLSAPWQPLCALLVMPGGRDLPMVASLAGRGNYLIRCFVEGGGAYWGICAGGYYGAKEVRFYLGEASKQIVGERELAFWPGACEGPTFPGFEYNSERGARGMGLDVDLNAVEKVMAGVRKAKNIGLAATPPPPLLTTNHFDHLYYNGGGSFVPLDPSSTSTPPGTSIIARYACHPHAPAAIVHIAVSKGQVLLTGAHPEYSVLTPPLNEILDRTQKELGQPVTGPEVRKQKESSRLELVRALLRLLGLRVPGFEEDGKNPADTLYGGRRPTHPMPQILNTHPDKPNLINELFDKLNPQFTPSSSPSLDKLSLEDADAASVALPSASCSILEGSHDTFRFHRSSAMADSDLSTFISIKRDETPPPSDHFDIMTKHVLVVEPDQRTEVENKDVSLMWDWKMYWQALNQAREEHRLTDKTKDDKWPSVMAGDLIFYSEAVTSTQTMWDK